MARSAKEGAEVARGRFVCHHLLITRRGYQKNENCMLNNVNLHMMGIDAQTEQFCYKK